MPRKGLEASSETIATLRSGHTVQAIRATLHGVPLSAPVAKVLVDPRGQVVLRYDVSPVPVSDTEDIAVPLLSADEALARVSAQGTFGSQGPASPELVFVPEGGSSRLVWRVDPPLDRERLTNPVFWVDAQTGDVRLAYDHVRSASVRAYSPNPVVSPQAAEYTLAEIDPGAVNLKGPSWRAVNCVEPPGDGVCIPQAIATADLEGNFLFPAPNIDDPIEATALGDAFAEASAYYHADRFQAYLLEQGLPGTPCQNAGKTPIIVTNYGHYVDGEFVPHEDAFYTGDCDFTIVVGQGPTLDLALDGDILYHEVAHGVIAQAAGGPLAFTHFRPEALAADAPAIGEALADFLSASFTNDPYVGDYLRDYGDFLKGRDIANTYTCPKSLMGKMHEDGEPFAAALWESYQALGVDFVPVVVDAVAMFASDVSFEEAAEVLAVVTGVELGSRAEMMVRDAFEVRGLTECERIVSWVDVERGMWLVPSSPSFSPLRPPAYQVEIDVPQGVDSLTLEFQRTDFVFGLGEPDAKLGLLQKAGTPITFEYSEGAQAYKVSHDADAEVGIAADTVELAVAEGKVYIAFANVGTTASILTELDVIFGAPATASTTEGEETMGSTTAGGTTGFVTTTDGATTTDLATTTDGATTAAVADDDSGCGCRAEGGGATLATLGWLGLLFGRRRSSSLTG